MTLPKALQDAEAKADALINGKAGNNPDSGNPANSNTGLDNGTPAPAQAAPQDPEKKPEDWKHKYDVLQGMFNQQVSSLQEKVRQLEGQANNSQDIEKLQQQLSQLQNDNSQLKQALSEQQSSQPAQLNPYLVEEYGDEFAGAVAAQAEALADRKIAALKQEYTTQLDELKSQFQSTQQSVNQVSTDNRIQTLTATLKAQNIDWSVTNNDPDFHKWLGEFDPYSGVQRQQLLESAFNSGDINRTARFYVDFVSQRGTPSNPLSQHVEPTSGFNPAETGFQQQQFNPNELQELSKQLIRGDITQADYDRRENELFARLR